LVSKKTTTQTRKKPCHGYFLEGGMDMVISAELFLLLDGCISSSSFSIKGVPKSLSPASPIPGKTIPSVVSSLSTVPTVMRTSGCVLAMDVTPSSDAITAMT
jgi:hypothetical protein